MNARLTLVRWILVVSLGCSLGLLLVYVAAWMRPMPDMGNANTILVTHQLRTKEAVFRLSQEEIEQELMSVIEAKLCCLQIRLGGGQSTISPAGFRTHGSPGFSLPCTIQLDAIRCHS